MRSKRAVIIAICCSGASPSRLLLRINLLRGVVYPSSIALYLFTKFRFERAAEISDYVLSIVYAVIADIRILTNGVDHGRSEDS